MTVPVIVQVIANADIETARALFREYSEGIGIDLCFQGFAGELAALPGDYAPPRGRLLVARCGADVAGCIAMRPLEPGVCEMKRLYVRARHRGGGVGRTLAECVIREARSIGYSRMRLDTLPTMTEALGLYRALGFQPIAPYRPNPIPGAFFLELAL